MNRSRSLRQVWAERHSRGLEPVLMDINDMLQRGEFDVSEWEQVKKADPITATAPSSRGGSKTSSSSSKMRQKRYATPEKEFKDWSPASVFGQEEQQVFARGSVISNPEWMPRLVKFMEQQLRNGYAGDSFDLLEILAKSFGGSIYEYEKEILSMARKIKQLLSEDEKYLQEEAERTRKKAIRGYAAQLMQNLWHVYRFKTLLAKSPFSQFRWAVRILQARFRSRLARRKALEASLNATRFVAASLIQEAFRAHRQRMYNREIARIRRHRLERIRQNLAARRVQRAYSRHSALRLCALITIQSCCRRWKAENTRRMLQAELLLRQERERRSKAEGTLARFLRRIKVKLVRNRQRRAVTVIQKCYRHYARVKIATAVVLIQTFVRSKSTRNKYLGLQRSIKTLQRKHKAWVAFQRKTRSTVVIQKITRGSFQRKRFQNAVCLVIALQAWVRMHSQRKLFVGERKRRCSAATLIQMSWRRCQSDQQKQLDEWYNQETQATIIQAISRGWTARKQYHRVRAKRMRAVLMIQKLYRCHLGRQLASRERSKALLRAERLRIAKEQTVAVVKIQKLFRIVLAKRRVENIRKWNKLRGSLKKQTVEPVAPEEEEDDRQQSARVETSERKPKSSAGAGLINSGRLYGKTGSKIGTDRRKTTTNLPPVIANDHHLPPSNNNNHDETKQPNLKSKTSLWRRKPASQRQPVPPSSSSSTMPRDSYKWSYRNQLAVSTPEPQSKPKQAKLQKIKLVRKNFANETPSSSSFLPHIRK